MLTLRNIMHSGLSRRLIVWFLVLSLIPLAVAGGIGYAISRRAMRDAAFDELRGVASGRREAIQVLEEVRLQEVVEIATRPSVIEELKLASPTMMESLNTELLRIQSVIKGFTTLYVFDAEGLVVASTDADLIGRSFADLDEFELAQKEPHVDSTIHLDEKGREVFDMSVPVFDPNTGEFLGVVTGEVSTKRLNQITTLRDGLGDTGEVYIVDYDQYMITESRFVENAPLNQKVDTFGVQEALEGREGVDTYTDYRGHEVVGAYLGMPEYSWILIAEMDQREAFTAVRNLTWALVVIFVISALVVAAVAAWISQVLARPILSLRDVAERLAEGDLTQEVHIQTKDEVEELAQAMQEVLNAWRRIMGDLNDEAVRLSTTAAELAASSEEISRTAGVQADQITNTSSATEEMVATIQEVARNAETAAASATESTQRAQNGAHSVTTTIAGFGEASAVLQRLSARSEEIGGIVSLIQEVAAQTNILALNAAIEAAGAGEAGARFDVVAEEIRKLAGRTREATTEIADLIHAVQSEAQSATQAMGEGEILVNEAGESLRQIVETSASVDDMMQLISAATEEQSRTSEEIATALEALASSSQETAAATRDTAQVGVELSNMAERLKEVAVRFKV